MERDTLCGTPSDTRGIGPFDYRDPSKHEKLKLVEHFHFFADTQRLALSGGTDLQYSTAKGRGASILSDLDYTLRAFPNHARALNAVATYLSKRGVKKPKAKQSVKCYFQRALDFAPGDPTVRLVYSIDRYKKGKVNDAIELLEPMIEKGTNDPEIHYNLGLYYIKAKRHKDALQRAHAAMALGYPMQGLARKLRRSGHWSAPESKGDQTR